MAENNPKPSEPIKPEPAPETVWTIMVYLAGDNNLADECVFALTQIKEVDTDKRVRVVAQFDPTGRRVRTRRFTINKALKDGTLQNKALPQAPQFQGWKNRGKIIEDTLEGNNPLPEGTVRFSDDAPPARQVVKPNDVVDGDSGDPKFLFDFISWSVENFPADHYMVVLSGHGGGVTEQEFLFDQTSKGTLTIAELGRVFKRIHGEGGLKNKKGEPLQIDIVGMDSCLMSMAEIAYELRDSVKYMISSESFGPRSGWPYGRMIERLNKSLDAGQSTPEDLGLITIDEHVDFYTEYAVTDGLSVDIAMMDLERADELTNAIHTLAEVLIGELKVGKSRKDRQLPSDFLDQIVLAHWEAQSYNGEVYVDLRDFCECLTRRYNPRDITPVPDTDPKADEVKDRIKRRTAVQAACEQTVNAIAALVKKSCYMGVDFQYSFGVSIYFPWAEVDPDYNDTQLSFVAASGWKNFLEAYVDITRRPPRNFEPGQLEVIGLDRVRKTPTDQRGPSNLLIRSMRNPPIDVVEKGLSDCTKDRLGLNE
ncbi:MAG TPA: clostripain-related cysteine peptidase [Pyrinomonadaceae bacterium]|nr:clostripain-related cysteine peptidase [Pyrinomonadaceae bacterium]